MTWSIVVILRLPRLKATKGDWRCRPVFPCDFFWKMSQSQSSAATCVEQPTQGTYRMTICCIRVRGSGRSQPALKNHQPTKEVTLNVNALSCVLQNLFLIGA